MFLKVQPGKNAGLYHRARKQRRKPYVNDNVFCEIPSSKATCKNDYITKTRL
jgi:hypothetical protein